MTRSQLATKIHMNLDDLGVSFNSVEDINESIQDGYDEIVVYTECIEKRTSLVYLADTTYYDFNQLIPDYYRLLFIHDKTRNWFMTPVMEHDTESGFLGWEISTGTVREYMILGPKYVGLSPRSSNVSGDFIVHYKATAPKLVDNSILRINSAYIQLPELFTIAEMLEMNQEFSKAQRYWVEYEKMLEEYRWKVQLWSQADRVFERTQIIYR